MDDQYKTLGQLDVVRVPGRDSALASDHMFGIHDAWKGQRVVLRTRLRLLNVLPYLNVAKFWMVDFRKS